MWRRYFSPGVGTSLIRGLYPAFPSPWLVERFYDVIVALTSMIGAFVYAFILLLSFFFAYNTAGSDVRSGVRLIGNYLRFFLFIPFGEWQSVFIYFFQLPCPLEYKWRLVCRNNYKVFLSSFFVLIHFRWLYFWGILVMYSKMYNSSWLFIIIIIYFFIITIVIISFLLSWEISH